MKEIPITFNNDMVRAILDGRKTQTRRVIEPQPELTEGWWGMNPQNGIYIRMWRDGFSPSKLFTYSECPYGVPGDILLVRETFNGDPMPRDAARIFLRVLNVRVDLVQDISAKDIKAEGVIPVESSSVFVNEMKTKGLFVNLWDSIYAKRGAGWDDNPWVWVVEFERIENYKI